jgi:dienelactone hydrolase
VKHFFVRHCGWWFLACVLSTTCVTGWAEAPPERTTRLAAHYKLDKPEGNGPFPAVMLVPACNGFNPKLMKEGRYTNAARRLKELGFAVIRVDYHAAGEVGSCELIMNPAEVADDIVTATKYLRAQSFIKHEAINVLGWSYGGGAAINALTKTETREPAQVAAVVAYYPYMALARPWSVDVPALILCAANDTLAPCERFESVLAEVPTRARVKVVKYPESYHVFDNPELPTKVTSVSGNTIGYNEKSATAAWAEVEKFLRR